MHQKGGRAHEAQGCNTRYWVRDTRGARQRARHKTTRGPRQAVRLPDVRGHRPELGNALSGATVCTPGLLLFTDLSG